MLESELVAGFEHTVEAIASTKLGTEDILWRCSPVSVASGSRILGIAPLKESVYVQVVVCVAWRDLL